MSLTSAFKIFESSHELTPKYQRRVGSLILCSALLAMILINLFEQNYSSVLSSESLFFGWNWSKFIDKGLMSIFFFAAVLASGMAVAFCTFLVLSPPIIKPKVVLET